VFEYDRVLKKENEGRTNFANSRRTIADNINYYLGQFPKHYTVRARRTQELNVR